MMKYGIGIVFAYLIGSLSPSALIAKIKHNKLKEADTGDLGATNTTLAFGKTLGFLVMILDILKGFLVVKLSARFLPDTEWFAMLAGFFAIVGHCFPFYLKFKGGKGLAAFGGVVLAYSPVFFLFVLITGVILVLIANSGTVISYYAAFLFPIHVAVTSNRISTVAVCTVMSLFMAIVFIPNLKKAFQGQEYKSRDFLKKLTDPK